MIKTYKDLIVWQKSVQFVSLVYKDTSEFPKEEVYGITSQIRRAAISIPSNIAEGYGRFSKKEYKRFIVISMGSLYELQTQLEIAVNLEYLTRNNHIKLYDKSRELEIMLRVLIKKLSP